MSDVAVDVHGLGKQYFIPDSQPAYETLRDSVTNTCASLVRRCLGRRTEADTGKQRFWALRDVSFDVRSGEVLGIVGRNGSGKSTLLKILSRIVSPTTGQARIHGRVGSLLEVGTGFHFELSGRENVYLSGAILGMKRAEISRKFDEIVEFSEISRFLDTPVKHYSSGMYMRLAFSVAAHLQSEILLVDEVLAVGDFDFQKKCIEKMRDLTRTGRTVLFVSHSMESVQSLCSRALLLSGGTVEALGTPDEIMRIYMPQEANTGVPAVHWTDETAPTNDFVRLRSLGVHGGNDEPAAEFDLHDDINLRIAFELRRPASCQLRIRIRDENGQWVFSTQSEPASAGREVAESGTAPVGVYQSQCCIPGHLLNDRQYSVSVEIRTRDAFGADETLGRENVLTFRVHDEDHDDQPDRFVGIVRPRIPWSTRLMQAA